MTEGGQIMISAEQVSVRPQDHSGLTAGTYVCLSVSDTGEGMDEETLIHAMEPFYTTKGVGKGTGLGLSMVHGLADQCGGKLVLESRKGHGTTATLWLPVATYGEAIGDGRLHVTVPSSAMRPLLILAVDDDKLVLTNTVAMLEDLGHRVAQATSGTGALEILAAHPIEMVITDYAMPGMTGLQLADAARAGWPDLPIILVSGYAELNSRQATELPKLSKPFREEDLIKAISEAALRHKARLAQPIDLPQRL
jgi:CheY-like chemotaxis protein